MASCYKIVNSKLLLGVDVMSDEFLITLAKEAILATIKLAGPALIVAMLVGLLISIFQAVTQIQEQTLTFVPKVIAIIVVLMLLGPWMLKTMVEFTQTLFNNMTMLNK